ncbi:MAG: hypothetical protein AAGI68_01850 [Planctomycetota bacterium]
MLIGLPGCHQVVESPDRVVMTFTTGTRWFVSAIALALFVVGGWITLKKSKKIGLGCLAVVLGFTGFFWPWFMFDRLTLDANGVHSERFWSFGRGPLVDFERVEWVEFGTEEHYSPTGMFHETDYVIVQHQGQPARQMGLPPLWHREQSRVQDWMAHHGVPLSSVAAALDQAEDPFEIEFGFGLVYRLDGRSAKERLQAALFSDAMDESQRDGDGVRLGDLIQSGKTIAGTFRNRVEHEGEFVEVIFTFEPEGRFTFETRSSPSLPPAPEPFEGSFRRSERSFLIEKDGFMIERLVPHSADSSTNTPRAP